MLGDNRDNYMNSRFCTPLPRANLRGRSTLVVSSYDPDVGLDCVEDVTAIRWRRLETWMR